MIDVSNSSAETFKSNYMNSSQIIILDRPIQWSSSTNSLHSPSTIFEFFILFFSINLVFCPFCSSAKDHKCDVVMEGGNQFVCFWQLSVDSWIMRMFMFNWVNRLLFLVAFVNQFMLFCIEILFISRFWQFYRFFLNFSIGYWVESD